jgi:hypothetical protein
MRKSRKIAIVAGSTVGALAIGGVAFAYWTSTGDGSGSATTGTSSSFVVTTDAATGGPLTPGGPSETVAFHVHNPSTGDQNLSAVAATVKNADGTSWTLGLGCSAADYTVSAPTFTDGGLGDMAPGADVSGTVTITMNNLASNQDPCQGATVPLFVHAS